MSSIESRGAIANDEGKWHRNAHGFYTYADGKRLSLDVGCDVIFQKMGRGK